MEKALYYIAYQLISQELAAKKEEVAASVFDRYREPLYKEAEYKPYIIAAK